VIYRKRCWHGDCYVRDMQILIVDDEPLARSRLRTLLEDSVRNTRGVPHNIHEAANAAEALAYLEAPAINAKDTPIELVLLDIHMPGLDGLQLAPRIQQMLAPPAIIFVTAHAEYALSAFDLDAVDYLTKPVRLARLQQAMAKVQRATPPASSAATPVTSAEAKKTGDFLTIHTRERMEIVPLKYVLYCRIEHAIVTVRTAARDYVMDGISLLEIEQRYPGKFVRISRNILMARDAIRSLERHINPDKGTEFWAVRTMGAGTGELHTVSRRLVAGVRAALGEGG